MGLSFEELRNANLTRCAKWHPGGVNDWSLSDWGVAMGGEAGETLNVIKKINRADDGLVGNARNATAETLLKALADEIADTIIYADLLAARAGIDLDRAIVEKFNHTSVKNGFSDRLELFPRAGVEYREVPRG